MLPRRISIEAHEVVGQRFRHQLAILCGECNHLMSTELNSSRFVYCYVPRINANCPRIVRKHCIYYGGIGLCTTYQKINLRTGALYGKAYLLFRRRAVGVFPIACHLFVVRFREPTQDLGMRPFAIVARKMYHFLPPLCKCTTFELLKIADELCLYREY